MIKRSVMAAFGLAFLTSVAMATPNALSSLNAEIARIIAPLMDDNTSGSLVFNDIQTDASHALSFGLQATLSKIGSKNQFALNVSDFSYNFNGGSSPTTHLAGDVKVDLTKIFAPDDINNLANDLEGTVKSFAHDYIEEYGEAVAISAGVTSKSVDADGNVTAMVGGIDFTLDLTKLPASIVPLDVMLLSGRLTFSVDFKTGFTVEANIVSNPVYRAFQQDSAGLKQVLDGLIALDPAYLDQLDELARSVNSMATDIVEGNF